MSFPAVLMLSDLNGVNGFKISGEVVDSQSGASVASAGDFNGDGLADLLIGAHGYDVVIATDAYDNDDLLSHREWSESIPR